MSPNTSADASAVASADASADKTNSASEFNWPKWTAVCFGSVYKLPHQHICTKTYIVQHDFMTCD